MEKIADNLHLLAGRPKYAFNVYVMGGVLIDAATRHARKRILGQLDGLDVHAHALTHAHADHQGASHAVCEALGLPLWAPAAEAEAVESGDLRSTMPLNLVTRVQLRRWAGPAHPVERRLAEGDDVGGFTALETPGHSPGHLAYWRESDRTLVAGDVMFGRHPLTGKPGLHQPPTLFTPDPTRNRESIRRLAALEPAVVCFGHGPPWRDTAALQRFAAALPA